MMTLVFVVGAYLIGSVSFAVLMSKAFDLPDPRTYGSNNPGATNVLRTGKKAAAALTLLGDAAKGWLAVWLTMHFGPQGNPGVILVALVVLAVFLGHLFPVFLKFQGGKGVATALGVLLALSGWLGLAAFGTWLLMAAVFRYSSLSALTAAVAAPAYALLLGLPHQWAFAALIMSFLLIWRHKSNIKKLLAGEENKIGKSKSKIEITISPMPDEIRQVLEKRGLGIPKACYSNCMHLLFHFAGKRQLEYVLVKAVHASDGIETDHAILREGGNYYDPTLEIQGQEQGTHYSLVNAFTFADICRMMKDKYDEGTIKKMLAGEEVFCILCPDGKGGFALE